MHVTNLIGAITLLLGLWALATIIAAVHSSLNKKAQALDQLRAAMTGNVGYYPWKARLFYFLVSLFVYSWMKGWLIL